MVSGLQNTGMGWKKLRVLLYESLLVFRISGRREGIAMDRGGFGEVDEAAST